MSTPAPFPVAWSTIVEHALHDPEMWAAARSALLPCLCHCRRRHGWMEDYDSVITLALVTALAAQPPTPEEAARMIRRDVRRHHSQEIARRGATTSLQHFEVEVPDHESAVAAKVDIDTALSLLDTTTASWCRSVLASEPVWRNDRATSSRVKRGLKGYSTAKRIKELLAS